MHIMFFAPVPSAAEKPPSIPALYLSQNAAPQTFAFSCGKATHSGVGLLNICTFSGNLTRAYGERGE